MKWYKTTNFYLLVSALVLFLIGVWVHDPFSWFHIEYEEAEPLLEDVSLEEITSFRIVRPHEKPLVFQKKGINWEVNGFPADKEEVKRLLELLLGIKRYYQVASSKEKWQELGVDPNSAIAVVLYKGEKEMAKLWIGKPGHMFNTTAVRKDPEEEVYLAKNFLRSEWEKDLSSFRDKTLLPLVKENVESYEITGKYSYRVEKVEEASLKIWYINIGGRKFPAKEDKIQEILSHMENLRGLSFYEKKKLPPFYAEVRIYLKGGITQTLEIRGPSKEGTYIGRSSQNPYWMEIPIYKVNTIVAKPLNLKKEEKKKGS